MIVLRHDIAAFLAHPEADLPALRASSIINQAATALSATLVRHDPDWPQKLMWVSKIDFWYLRKLCTRFLCDTVSSQPAYEKLRGVDLFITCACSMVHIAVL